jgi:SRSO17 transposase
MTMNQAEFDRATDAFWAFHQRFAPLFGRVEAQRRGEQYLRGLLVQQTDRRNAENLAEAVDGATPRALQRLLTEAPWPVEPVIDALHAYLAPRLADPDGVLVLDDTGFAKQGRHSVGVARQYSGTLGKVGNCQVGVFLGYVAPRGHALIDMRLYLPRPWADDQPRRARAGVPAAVTYQSKAELGLALLRAAKARGRLHSRWVTGDEGYGQAPSLRDGLDEGGWWYVLEVPAATPAFAARAATAVPAWSGRGRKPTKPRLVDGAPRPAAARELAAGLPDTAWQELIVAEGAQGPRAYQFAACRIWESRDGLPGRACWLVLRRNPDGTEPKYYLSNAPAHAPLATLGRVGSWRWPIETLFQADKGEAGLDEYEVRGWRGWHHHITLSLLAGAFLLTIQQDWGGKDAPADRAAGQPGAARGAAPPHLDGGRLARLADRHPAPQHPRLPLPRPATLVQVA